MTLKYTDADVQNLVKCASDAAEILDETWDITKPSLKAALKPFLPDPDEGLLTDMCVAFTHAPRLPGFTMVRWEDRDELSQQSLLQSMRSALEVVKSKGLPQ